MAEVPYIAVGKRCDPTKEQHARAEKNGGWTPKKVFGFDVMWNPCVSPPFACNWDGFVEHMMEGQK